MSQPKNLNNIQTVVICPFYNEEHTIGNMFDTLVKTELSVIFVNDGSIDRSYPILFNKIRNSKRLDLILLNYKLNRGKGFAIKLGAEEAIKRGYNYCLFIDSDEQNDIEDIDKFISLAKLDNKARVVIGNRLYNPKDMPKIRYLTNKFMSWLISKLAGCKILDSQCGMRLVHKDIFDLNLIGDRFELESEMLIKAGRKGYKIRNVPIKSIYKKGRRSKIRPFKDMIRFFKMIKNLLRKD